MSEKGKRTIEEEKRIAEDVQSLGLAVGTIAVVGTIAAGAMLSGPLLTASGALAAGAAGLNVWASRKNRRLSRSPGTEAPVVTAAGTEVK